jgi:hypothetical protein
VFLCSNHPRRLLHLFHHRHRHDRHRRRHHRRRRRHMLVIEATIHNWFKLLMYCRCSILRRPT